jgi:hypothetical protein
MQNIFYFIKKCFIFFKEIFIINYSTIKLNQRMKILLEIQGSKKITNIFVYDF